jgi:glycosyltransferase 2 family protein
MNRKALQFWSKVIISVLLLALLARSLPLVKVVTSLRQVPLSAWLGNTLLLGLATALGAWRWHLAAARIIPLKTCLNYYWIGIFYSYVLPGSLAGDVARTAALAAHAPEHRSMALPVSAVLDRLGGVSTMLLVLVLAFAGMFWSQASHALIIGVVLISVVGLLYCPLLLHRGFRELAGAAWLPKIMRRLAESVVAPLSHITLPAWLRILAISLVIHLITCASYAWSAQATGVQGELWRIALYYAVFNLAVMLPITIAGIGLREHCAIWLLGKDGAAGTASVALSWFILAVMLVHLLIGAALHVQQSFKQTRPRDNTP